MLSTGHCTKELVDMTTPELAMQDIKAKQKRLAQVIENSVILRPAAHCFGKA